MNKATIISTDTKWAYVFTEDCQVKKISWQPEMKLGQEIRLEPETAGSQPVRSRSRGRLRPALVGLTLLLLLAVGVLFGLSPLAVPVYATVSLDVNPSLQLELNRDLTVRQVRALNTFAEQTMVGLELKGLDWQAAILQWSEQNRHYTENGMVLISAVIPAGEEQLRNQLLAMEQNRLNGLAAEVRAVYSHNGELRSAAAENGLSIGRQMLYNQARAQHRNWGADEIRGANLGELIRELLQKGEPDQSGLANARQAGRNQETLDPQETQRETHRETHRETTGTEAEDPDGEQNTNQETHRETHRETTGTKAEDPDGEQNTNQETHRETQRETTVTGTEDPDGEQPTNQETHRETYRYTTAAEGNN